MNPAAAAAAAAAAWREGEGLVGGAEAGRLAGATAGQDSVVSAELVMSTAAVVVFVVVVVVVVVALAVAP